MIDSETINKIYAIIQISILCFPFVVAFIVWAYKLYKTLNYIMAELKPNSGSSLRDAINRIENKVATIDLAQKAYMDVDSPIPIFQTDFEGNLVWVNKAYLKLVSRPMNEVLGTGWELIIPQEERSRIREEWYRAIKEHRVFEYCYDLINSETENKIRIKCKAHGTHSAGYIGFLYHSTAQEC